ncbi:MAG: hypothetical protein Q9160_007113 [Pyrenula sp. 1 TL-2023]
MADTMSIEEANKIRIAVGMKPLPVPGAAAPSDSDSDDDSISHSDSDGEPASTLATREAAAGENWKRIQDEAAAKQRRQEAAAKIRRAQDTAQKYKKLEGKGLGDTVEDQELDTKAWLMGQKKRQKKLEKARARKMEEELAERERLASLRYDEADLAGVKVGHEANAFEGVDGEQILTLKDNTIEENEEEGDELENLGLREKEALKDRLELKKRKAVYDPHADAEDGERKILGQYDEEIDGKKRKRFTLGGLTGTIEEREAKRQEVGERLRAQPITLDILKELPQSDYVEVSEVKMKKPKKGKKKSTRKKSDDEDDIFPADGHINGRNHDDESMDVDSSVPKPPPKSFQTSFVDDDDLQASLAAQRTAVFKKRKRQKPEDLARQLREEGSATPNEMDIDAGDGAEEAPGLVIDETSEFVANLQRPTAEDDRRPRRSAQPSAEPPLKTQESGDEDGDVPMQTGNGAEDEEDGRVKLEDSNETPQLPSAGLEAEATLDQGIGSTLNLLKQRGLVKTADMGDVNALHRDRQKFLAEKHRREDVAERQARLQRERDRASGKLDRMSAREREDYARWENKIRDQKESREMADIFNREYKPDVQLKYVDDHGRLMNQKEAFKHLSHQFHGKGSGKQKTEKQLKKVEDEKRQEGMSVLDASQNRGGYDNAQGAMTKKNRQAGVRLA